MKFLLLSILSVSASLSLISADAYADSSASFTSEISGFQYQVSNLNTGDSQHAAIYFQPTDRYFDQYSYVAYEPLGFLYKTGGSVHGFDPALSVMNFRNKHVINEHADTSLSNATIQGYGAINERPSSFGGAQQVWFYFLISPESSITFSGHFAGSSSTFTNDATPNLIANVGYDFSARLYGSGNSVHEQFSSESGQGQTLARDFSFTLTNSSSNYQQAEFSSVVYGWAGNNAPAVPEPETYAMLAAGLAVLTYVARRRAHRQRQSV